MTDPEVPMNIKQRLGYHASILGVIALGASALLVAGYVGTKSLIDTRLDEDMQASLQQVIPESLHDNNLVKDTTHLNIEDVTGKQVNTIFYRARLDKKITAIAYQVAGYGYSGEIDIILGVDITGKLLGVRVVSHSETPGLGDRIELGKSKWVLSFNGLSLENPKESLWGVKKDGGYFDQFTGATITPRAVVAAIKHGLKQFSLHKAELIESTAASPSSPLPNKAGVNQHG